MKRRVLMYHQGRRALDDLRMTAVGETLRRERLRRNLDLDSISRELKISTRMLQAIEDERFERLPGGVFARSFVRQYARLLGLDEAELAAQVQRQLEPGDEVPKLPEIQKPIAADLRVPRVERWSGRGDSRPWSSSLPALALLVLAMLVCSGIYAWWQKARRAPAVTASVSAAGAPAPTQTQPPPAPASASPVPETPATAAPETSGAQPPAAQFPAAQQPSVPTAAPAPPSDSNAPVRVEVTADEQVWVSARSDGKYVFSVTLAPGQKRTVDAGSEVVLRLGNAGGASISLNGKPIGAVGPKGQVRQVQLTSGGFKIALPKSASAPVPPLEP